MKKSCARAANLKSRNSLPVRIAKFKIGFAGFPAMPCCEILRKRRKKMKTDLLQEKSAVLLPEGFMLRGAKLEDVEPALMLFNAWSQSVIQADEITDANSVREEWTSPGFDPARDIRLVFSPNGEMAGYVEVWTNFKPLVDPRIWGRVHPRYEGVGIGTWLMNWAEGRVLQELKNVPDDLRVASRVSVFRQAEKSRKLFEELGFHHIRTFYHMVIHMDGPVPEPVWPQGISLRTYNPETDAEAVYRADEDAFRDHFGFVEEPFEEGFAQFKHFHLEYEGSDPTLTFLAIDERSAEIAGINLCRPHSQYDPDMGWVSSLGVLRPWRKRGIGLALLRHSFNEFYRRGKRKVGLGVDAENLTGALRIYENAGMQVERAYDLYEKELRAGTEISVQSLAQ
jgi:mycothiol synthase